MRCCVLRRAGMVARVTQLLEVQGLDVTYHTAAGGFRVLQDVDLAIAQGMRVALVGESGSGKSTLALAIGGFLTADAVTMSARKFEIDGQAVPLASAEKLPRKRPGLSMVFQDAMTSLDSVWTIGSQLTSVLRATDNLSREEARDRAREWLVRVGLNQTERVMKARPYELSGGMRQRVMLAIALCTRPRLLIADEPTSALDAVLAESVMELMSELTDQLSASLLIVSHDIELCRQFADTIVVFRHGKVIEQLDTASLSEARHPYSRGLLNCIPTLEGANLDRLPTLDDFARSTDDPEVVR